ncbi:WGR domain-containing protein [Pseudomonas sp.]|uniref:WGR domain-containing protein n=1 Tax=Pseudomonas sp. TaxID=306 RepID=UPI0028969288|nr:WGR domain-containing protein [Pseudomonas sp.]
MIGIINSLEIGICKHYLELSDDSTGKHNFYEIELDLDSFLISIRYGRIGTNGQSQKISFKTAEEAKK